LRQLLIEFQSVFDFPVAGSRLDMKKVLSQQEIDAILGKARGEESSTEAEPRTVEPCDFRVAGQLSELHARIMTSLYEGFARSAANALGAYLRTRFDLTLASVELMPLKDFLSGFQDAGFVSFLHFDPAGAVGLLQFDGLLVFPIIDVLLGGIGAPAPASHGLTEIDEDIMDGVAQVLCRQLEPTWQPAEMTIGIDRQLKPSQVPSLYLPTEKLISLTFEARLNETSGAVNLSYPAALANPMLRGAAADAGRSLAASSENHLGLQQRVLDCQFDTAVGLPELRVSLRELIALRPGSVLNLRLPVKNPVSLLLGGSEYFEAAPVRSGRNRAAQLLRKNSMPMHCDG
jgi:flagellar motor switch protein FliM